MHFKRILVVLTAAGLALGLAGVATATTVKTPAPVTARFLFPCANREGYLTLASPFGDLCYWNPTNKTINVAGKAPATLKLTAPVPGPAGPAGPTGPAGASVTGPAGPAGPTGPAGASTTEGVVETATASAPGTAVVFCPAAYPYADGGGGTIANVPAGQQYFLTGSYPIVASGHAVPAYVAAGNGQQATGWAASFNADCTITVYVTCSSGSAVKVS